MSFVVFVLKVVVAWHVFVFAMAFVGACVAEIAR